MKLFELSTDEAASVLCEISPMIDNIAQDEAIMETLGVEVKTEGKSRIGVYMETIKKLTASVPMLLKNHRADVFGILAAVNRKTVTEIAAQPLGVTMREIKELFTDPELIDFFGLSKPQGQKE